MGKAFITIGNFSIDNVVSADGRVALRKIGGNSVFSAIGARYWSQDVGIATTIPLNYPVDWLEELAAGGIDLGGVRRVPPAVELEEWFFYRPDGSRKDRLYARYDDYAYLADRQTPLSKSHVEQMISDMENNTMRGVSLADFRSQNPISIEVVPDFYYPIRACHLAPNHFEVHRSLVKFLKQQGVFVSLDPAPYTSQVPAEDLADLLSHVDVFLPSEKELSVICPDLGMEEAIRWLSKLTPLVVAKLGEDGVIIYNRSKNQQLHFPAYPTKVTDLTGAGDSFCGGFMVGMVETGDPVQAAQYGIVSASLNIEAYSLKEKMLPTRAHAAKRLRLFREMIGNPTSE
jgi:hypothetical protein